MSAHEASPGAAGTAGRGVSVGGNADVRADNGSIAAVSIGEVHQHVHPAGREPVSWPHLVGVIPPRAGAFQDRAERSRLREAVAGGGTAVLCQVLTGMGGVGKTQLAADFAARAWEARSEVDLLVWATATSRDAVVAAFAQAGVEVCAADPADPQRAAGTFLTWLRTGGRRWLVVFDDVADPNDLTGLWPPSIAQGRTVVTTRRRDSALTREDRQRIDVGVFTTGEAVAYLASVLAAEGRTAPADDLAALAAALGYLPLALSQAAAYIVDAGITVSAYQERLARRAPTLEDVSPDALPDEQVHTMAAAWNLSIEYADRLRPRGLARPMLELAAFLAPNGIPMPVLTSDPALVRLAVDAEEPVTADDAAGALRALHRLSLLTAPDVGNGTAGDSGDRQSVRVHQVVQRATRDHLTGERYERTAHAAADALLAVWPDVERDAAVAQALRACAAALVACTEEGSGYDGCLYRSQAHPVLDRAGRSLGGAGQITAAITHFRRLADATARHLGADHRDTLDARHGIARWRGEAGDSTGAGKAFAALLTDQLRVLGPEDRDTLATRHQIARCRGEAGDAAGAAESYAELLTDMVRVFGPDHSDVLSVRSNVAYWRGTAGDASGAAEAFTELLADRLRLLDPDTPHTLITRSNLAFWRGKAGDAAGAAEAFAELFQDSLRVLGPDHIDTLIARHNLAHWSGAAGDAAGSAEAFTQLLADRLRVLGPDHPQTLATRHDLARWRGQAGDAAGAAEALAELLGDSVRVLGPDHPETLATRGNLLRWRGEATKGEH